MIADWCRQDANCGDVRELREPLDPYAFDREQEDAAALVFGRWAGLVLNEAIGRTATGD